VKLDPLARSVLTFVVLGLVALAATRGPGRASSAPAFVVPGAAFS